MKLTEAPRDQYGRFLQSICTDPNCSGSLVLTHEHDDDIWRCDGLTYDREGGPLVPCERWHLAGRAALEKGQAE